MKRLDYLNQAFSVLTLLSPNIQSRQTTGNATMRRSVSSVAEETGEYDEELT